ncbi:hypothetical protein PENTCL1PPCAC_1955, partial [Pristionchus entomophagus]
LISTILVLPLVFSLHCYTFETPTGANLTAVEKTTVQCPITSRFCLYTHQQNAQTARNSMFLEVRGCADDAMCQHQIHAQSTGCIGAGEDWMCC